MKSIFKIFTSAVLIVSTILAVNAQNLQVILADTNSDVYLPLKSSESLFGSLPNANTISELFSPASIYVINSTLDTPDAAPGNNICADSSSVCTLRAAIQEANAHAGADTINFSIGSGLKTITPATVLPDITDSVTIDATTQPGYAGVPLIELSGGILGSSHDGLYFLLTGNSTVRGLNIHGFRKAIAFDSPLSVSGNNVVENCYIGTDPTGTMTLRNDTGIYLNSGGNRVGGLAVAQRNVISGNSTFGINLAADGNLIQGNYIGTNASGTATLTGLPVPSQTGVFVNSNGNTIGGTSPGSRNIISGNSAGITITATAPITATNNFVQGNYIGTDKTGTLAVGNFSGGVQLRHGATNNTIGGTFVSARNVISGNLAGNAVSLKEVGVSGNFVQGNYIGTDASGTNALGNGGVGVFADQSSFNTIGGAGAGAGNVIAANSASGIGIFNSSDYLIQNNLIGTNAAGTSALPNADGGIVVNGFGMPVSTNMVIKDNLISGNVNSGIAIFNSNDNQIQGNLIGTKAGGISPLGNTGTGIFLGSAASNIIGGNSAVLTNLISGNGGDGVMVSGAAAMNNQILGNLVGTDVTGTLAVGNSGNGVKIDNAPSNTIGAATAQNAVNTISGNGMNGVLITGAGAADNKIVGNRIGTNASGTAAVPNAQNGARIDGGAASNKVGDLSATPGIAPGNLISGQASIAASGVLISGTGTRLNSVFGNLIGTKVGGTAAIPNRNGVKIELGATQNLVGEKILPARNIISGNNGIGVLITDSGTSINQVQGNYIGTDISGTSALANMTGVLLSSGATDNIIGGAEIGSRNVISGNSDGVDIASANNNTVQSNFIGTKTSGNAALRNDNNGILITSGSLNNQIGGTTLLAANVVSGNGINGILLDSGAGANGIEGNFIGLAADGTTPLGNTQNGIQIGTDDPFVTPANNRIGGAATGAGNRIAGNLSKGVFLVNALKTSILSNSIFNNFNLGISFSPIGVTSNDACDADTGANDRQNFPVLDSAVNVGGITSINGTLDSTASAAYTIQIFVNDVCDPSNYGEGQTLVDSFTVNTDAMCQKMFIKTVSPQIPAGKFLTATATDAFGNTSEFSKCKIVGAPTAANVGIGGRVTTANGQGIRNARLLLTDGSGRSRDAQTGTFGFYRFEAVTVGETYVLTVYSKRYVFAEPTRIISLSDDLTDLNFTSEP